MASTLTRRDLISRAKGLAVASPFLSLAACGSETAASRPALLSGTTMGTSYSVKFIGPPPGLDQERLAADVDRLLEAVNARMSTYRPNSELSRFNGSDGSDWVPVSADTLAVIEEAQGASALTGGAFDPTIGPLVDLWGFGPAAGDRKQPAESRIQDALARVGYGQVRMRQPTPALAKADGGVRVDLSGIAKGFGVDKVAAHLEEIGIEHYLVEVGGELRGGGRNAEDGPWRVGIEKPLAETRSVQRVARLDGKALATSGDYRIFFERDGEHYSHIIDPRNGRPVSHGLASVTVIAESTMRADALSTALMVLGPEAGLELATREKLAAFFIVKRGDGFEEIAAPEFAPYLIS